MKKIISIVILAWVLAIGMGMTSVQAAANNLSGWAWSSNIGWLSFSSANTGAGTGPAYNVTVATTSNTSSVAAFGGYAWSPHVGWVSFNPSDTSSCPSSDSIYDKPTSQGGVGADLVPGTTSICLPRVDLANGKVSGWARVLSIAAEGGANSGWLHLSGTNHGSGSGGVVYDPTSKKFTGFAWESSSIGWINFDALGGSNTVTCPGCTYTTGGGGDVDVSCSKTPNTATVSSGTTVTFTATGSGGNSPYTYSWNSGPFDTVNTKSIVYTANGSGPLVRAKDNSGVPSRLVRACPSVVVSGSTVNSGLKLMIMPPSTAVSSTDYDDTQTSNKSLTVVSGNPFKLQWNIDSSSINAAAGYERCASVVTPSDGPSTSWGGFASGIQAAMQTNGVPTGSYTFRLSCSGKNVITKTSSVSLKIISSSLEEF